MSICLKIRNLQANREGQIKSTKFKIEICRLDLFKAAGAATSYTYTGREWDKETGLYYYRARYYDPMEGMFISKDPIGFAGGDVNLYRYVGNNVVNLVDPTGNSKCCPSAEMDQILRRIREIRSILNKLYAGNLPGGSGEEELGKTTCWPGGNPTWRTSNSRGECVKECLEEHEATHGYQCITSGFMKFNTLSKSAEIANEISAYKAELSCLEGKCR